MTEAKAPAPAPDFALPWTIQNTGLSGLHVDIFDARGKSVFKDMRSDYAELILSAVNNAAAKDAAIARLRGVFRFDIDEANRATSNGSTPTISNTEIVQNPEPRDAEIARLREALSELLAASDPARGRGTNRELDARAKAVDALSSIPTASDTEMNG